MKFPCVFEIHQKDALTQVHFRRIHRCFRSRNGLKPRGTVVFLAKGPGFWPIHPSIAALQHQRRAQAICFCRPISVIFIIQPHQRHAIFVFEHDAVTSVGKAPTPRAKHTDTFGDAVGLPQFGWRDAPDHEPFPGAKKPFCGVGVLKGGESKLDAACEVPFGHIQWSGRLVVAFYIFRLLALGMIHDLGKHHLFGVEQGQGRQVEQAPEKRMGRFNEMQMDVFHENRNRSPSGVARRLRASKVTIVCQTSASQFHASLWAY